MITQIIKQTDYTDIRYVHPSPLMGEGLGEGVYLIGVIWF